MPLEKVLYCSGVLLGNQCIYYLELKISDVQKMGRGNEQAL